MTSQIVEEQIQLFNQKFRNTDWYPNNWKPIEDFIRSLASTLIEKVGSELIGEDEDIKILIAPMFKTMGKIRNQLRAEMRTKLQEMR